MRREQLRIYPVTVAIVVFFFAFAVSAFGQVAGGTIQGTVTDASGAVVPAAVVTISNPDTGFSRAINTNSDGAYTAPNLVPGSYRVSAASSGFAPALQTTSVTVGATQTLNFSLRVGTATQAVEVSGTSTNVQLSDSTLSDVVNAITVRELPLNGRSWTDLATLQPGVASPQMQPPFNGGRGQRGFGNQISISGSRPQENNYRLNGVNVNDYANGGPGNVEGGALGVDAIQEFSVLTGTYSAEYGRASGGVINAITRSGTNGLHGSAYEFFRNSVLDSRNYFDVTRPPFKRNQFGGSLGGPIVKDKTFFFADYEGLREAKGQTIVSTVPTAAARAGNLASGTVVVDPSVARFLQAFYPLPNGAVKGDTGVYSQQIQRVNNENFLTTRVDHNFSSKDALNGSYMYDNTNLSLPDEFATKLSSFIVGRKIVTLEETHTFSPQFVNTVRFGFSRTPANVGATISALKPTAADATFGSIPGRNAPDVKASGMSEFTGGLGAPSNYNFHYNSWQYYDDAFVTKGNHSLRFGASVERIQDNVTAITDGNGAFTFGSLAAFLTNKPNAFKGAIPSTVTGRSIRQTIPGFYLQDNWRFRPRLTFNLGARYEFSTVPTENNGKLSQLLNITDPAPHLGGPYFLSNPTIHNIEPRIGFALDPTGSGQTSIRGGFGIYDVLPLPYQHNFEYVFTAPFFSEGTNTTLPAGTFPTGAFPLIAAGASTLRQNYFDPRPSRNYVMQYDLNVQRQLTSSLMATVGYIGSRGIHQPFRSEDINMVLPTKTAQGYLWPSPIGSGTKINPNVGVTRGLFYDGHSYYDALETQLTKKMSRGFQAQVSYTWSKNIDTGTAGVSGDTFANSIASPLWFDMSLNRGLSDLNISHNLVANYTWVLPNPSWASGPAGWVLRGWQTGGIYRASSGVPFTVSIGGDPLGQKSDHAYDVPNRVMGGDCSSLTTGNPLAYIKTQCFTVPTPANLRGNAGRNILTGPGLQNIDFSLFKNNRIRERVDAQFRVEVFNILNHANFAPPLDNTNAFDGNLKPIGSFGQIDSTASPERQIQFALKLTF